MTGDKAGVPLGIPANPLKIGRVVHGCDADGACAPLLVCLVHDNSRVSGIVFAAQQLRAQALQHEPRPDVKLRIALPDAARPAPTWHWPAECPWNR